MPPPLMAEGLAGLRAQTVRSPLGEEAELRALFAALKSRRDPSNLTRQAGTLIDPKPHNAAQAD